MSAISDEIELACERALRKVLAEQSQRASAPLDPNKGLSVAEAARVASRSPDTVRRAIKAGALKASRPSGAREWVVAPGDLESWLGRGEISKVVDLDFAARQALARAKRR